MFKRFLLALALTSVPVAAMAAYNPGAVLVNPGIPVASQTQLAGYINALWFGADPTGTNDSTTALGTFFAYGLAHNYGMYIPSGTYKATCGTLGLALFADQQAKVYGDAAGDRLSSSTGTVLNFASGSGTCIAVTGPMSDGASASLKMEGVTFFSTDGSIGTFVAATNQGNIALQDVSFNCPGTSTYGFTESTSGSVSGNNLKFERVTGTGCASRIGLLTSPSDNIGIVHDKDGISVDELSGIQLGTSGTHTAMQNIDIDNLFSNGDTNTVVSYDGIQNLHIHDGYSEFDTSTDAPAFNLLGQSIAYSSFALDNEWVQRPLASNGDCEAVIDASAGIVISTNTQITGESGSGFDTTKFFACAVNTGGGGNTNVKADPPSNSPGLKVYANRILNLAGVATTYTVPFDSNNSILGVTASSGAATCNSRNCTVTTDSLTTAPGSGYTVTLTDSQILAGSSIQATLTSATNTQTGAVINSQPTITAGQAVIAILNTGQSNLNGTLNIVVTVVN